MSLNPLCGKNSVYCLKVEDPWGQVFLQYLVNLDLKVLSLYNLACIYVALLIEMQARACRPAHAGPRVQHEVSYLIGTFNKNKQL